MCLWDVSNRHGSLFDWLPCRLDRDIPTYIFTSTFFRILSMWYTNFSCSKYIKEWCAHRYNFLSPCTSYGFQEKLSFSDDVPYFQRIKRKKIENARTVREGGGAVNTNFWRTYIIEVPLKRDNYFIMKLISFRHV